MARDDGQREAFTANVGAAERWVSALAGGALTAYGLRRRSPGGLGLAAVGGVLLQHGVSGRSLAYRALGVDTTSTEPVRVTAAVSVMRPRPEVWAFWRDLSNLPRFLRHLDAVSVLSPRLSRWTAALPGAPPIRWTAEIVSEEEGRRLEWRSAPGSEVLTEGRVAFEDVREGATGIRLDLAYEPPGGRATAAVARLLRPITAQQVRDDLRRLKARLEAGEVAGTEGQPRGGNRHWWSRRRAS